MSSRICTVIFLFDKDGPVNRTSLRLKVSPAINRKKVRNNTMIAADRRDGADFVRPNLEARQRARAECGADRDVASIAAPGNEHPADARRVVAGVKSVPAAVEEGLEPGREIHRPIGRWLADVTEVAGAVASRNIHAPAEGNGEMGIVAADTDLLVQSLHCRARLGGVLIPEADMAMNIVADRLNAAPSGGRLPEEIPRRLGQTVGFAIATAQQKLQRLRRQIRHEKLSRLRNDRIRGAGIVDQRVDGHARATAWRDDAGTLVAEGVPIGRRRNGRVERQIVTAGEIGRARGVNVEVEDHRSWLRTVVDHLEADANFHRALSVEAVSYTHLTLPTKRIV